MSGDKNQAVPFIFSSIQWNGDDARWIEPFLGSGIVALNLMLERALLADTNLLLLFNGKPKM